MAPKFSVVLIARNESKTLPRLLDSLKEFCDRGGEVILLDTGSKDNTVDIARGRGVKVTEVGDKFRVTLDKLTAKAINQFFIVGDEKEIVMPGQSFFDFASARNFAASLASNNMIAMPDCDEIYTAFNIDHLDARIEAGVTQFEYDFVFSHDEQGRPDVSFRHSKFYDRTVLEWVGCVHEILRGHGSVKNKCEILAPSLVKLEHWQNQEQTRGQYLTGLAYDCFHHPDKDRNSHYLAREFIYTNRYNSAIQEFKRHMTMNGWSPERAQSAVFIGDAYAYMGNEEQMVLWYQQAINIDATRREPLMKLAAHYFRKKDSSRTAIYASAALTVDNRGYYMDRAHYYRENPHMMLYWAFYFLDKKEEALKHWRAALAFSPDNTRILADAQWYVELPRVTVVIPTLNRPEKLARVQELIKANANYPNYDVLVMQDDSDNRKGVVKMVNEGVERATGDLVMFLSDDCEPQPNFLIQAVLEYKNHRGGALVALNDGMWKGALATHWLTSKLFTGLMPGGHFFHPDFHHHGCDNFLTAVFKAKGQLAYAPLARVNHKHDYEDASSKLAYTHDTEDKATLARLLTMCGLEDPV